VPIAQLLVIQRRGIAGEDDLAGQALEQRQQRDVIGLRVVEAVAPLRGAGVLEVRGIAVDQLTALKRIRGQKPVGTTAALCSSCTYGKISELGHGLAE
jgi:hypothetical protein